MKVYVSSTETVGEAYRRLSAKCTREHIKEDYLKHISFRSKNTKRRDKSKRKNKRSKRDR